MEQLTNCPQCLRHCPADALSCGRGKAFFAGEQDIGDRSHHEHDHERREHGPHGRPDKYTLEGLLMICGHHLHHGGADDLSFAVLSANEQEELKLLLTKLVDSWE